MEVQGSEPALTSFLLGHGLRITYTFLAAIFIYAHKGSPVVSPKAPSCYGIFSERQQESHSCVLGLEGGARFTFKLQ